VTAKPGSRRRVRWGLVVVATVALTAGGLAWWYRSASLAEQHAWETRLSLVSLKVQGRIPHVSWGTIAGRIGSRWLKDGPPPLARIVQQGPAPCTALWDTAMGRFWGTPRDGRDLDWIVMEQIGWHIYDRSPVKVRRGDVVFDVGAHLGTFTRFALDRGARQVVMFEPQRVNAECLRRTFAREMAARRVILVEAAAWHTRGELAFEDEGPGTMGHVREGTTAKTVAVRAVTFDDVVEELGLSAVDYIKMDIEGAERHALAGGRRMLAAHRPRMAICIYHTPDDALVIPALVREANASYQIFTRSGFQAYFH